MEGVEYVSVMYSLLRSVTNPHPSLPQDVLLLYYTDWCGFCSVLNHVLIKLARLLQNNSRLTVAR